jgi:ribosomal-protein-alanine N-acetyltransferase
VSWQLRSAALEDVDAIKVIEDETFPYDAWSSEQLASDIGNPDCYYLVAVDSKREQNSGLIGYAGLLAPKGSGEGDIQTIAVASAARRQGLGRVFMQSLLAEARKRRAVAVFLEVRVDNDAAIALYRSLGFEEIGVRRRYYKDGSDALTMKYIVQEPRTMIVGVD